MTSTELTPCPACGHSVSSAARSCPECGHPIAPPSVQTIEQTSKWHKAVMLTGVLFILAGTVLWVRGCGSGPVALVGWGQWLVIIGILAYGAARVHAWWRHG